MPRLRVKFCGIMSVSDARAAADAGADAIGLIVHAQSRRKISADVGREIVAALPPYVTPVGLFVNAGADAVLEAAGEIGLKVVQFHGDETPADVAAVRRLQVIKVFAVDDQIESRLPQWREACRSGQLPNLSGILLDGAGGGGTGVENDFARIAKLQQDGQLDGLPPLILAGGLHPDNVAAAVKLVRPYAVDLSSGIEEAFGRKSVRKMNAFIQNATTA